MMPVYQDGLLGWLARFVANRGLSLALVAAVVIVDFTIPWQGMSFVPRALAKICSMRGTESSCCWPRIS